MLSPSISVTSSARKYPESILETVWPFSCITISVELVRSLRADGPLLRYNLVAIEILEIL
jgi:hypothetical protein